MSTINIEITATAEKAMTEISRLGAAFDEATDAVRNFQRAYKKLPWFVRATLHVHAAWERLVAFVDTRLPEPSNEGPATATWRMNGVSTGKVGFPNRRSPYVPCPEEKE